MCFLKRIIPVVVIYKDSIPKPKEKPRSDKPRLTLDALSGVAENDKIYKQYKKTQRTRGD